MIAYNLPYPFLSPISHRSLWIEDASKRLSRPRPTLCLVRPRFLRRCELEKLRCHVETASSFEVPLVRQAISQGSPQLLYRRFRSARGRVRLRRSVADDDPRRDRGAAADRCGGTASCCRSTASRPSGCTSAAPRWSAPTGWPGPWASSELYIKNDAVNYPDALVQGSRGRRGAVEGGRVRLPDRRLRLDGQPGQQRGGQRRDRRPRGLCAHPRRPRARQGARRHHLRRQGHRHRGQLRPGQPALLPDRVPVRLGIRQRQPPAVLRRGIEDDRLRDRRGPGLAHARSRGRPDGRRQPDRQDSQGVQGTRAARPDRRAGQDQDARRPGHRLQPDLGDGQDGRREGQAGPQSRTRSPRAWPSATRPTASSPRN